MSCCDPKRLPHAILESQAGRELSAMMAPNAMLLPAQAWHKVTVKHPAVVVPVGTQAGTIYASPGKPGDATSATTLAQTAQSIPRGAILPNPGEWYLYYNTAATLQVVVHDGFNPLQAIEILGALAKCQYWDPDASNWFDMVANTLTNMSGDAGNLVRGLITHAVAFGHDLTGGGSGVVRAVGARDGTLGSGWAAAAYGQIANARIGGYNPVTGDFIAGEVLHEVTGSSRGAHATYNLRKAGYWSGLQGRRFVLCMPATVTAQSGSSFSATAPVLLFVAPATNEWIVRRVRIHWYDAITVATTRVRFVTDPDNRYSSGGVSMIPTGGFKSTTRGSSGAALTPTQARYNDGITAIVATAADDDEFHYGDLAAEDNEGELIWTPDDEIIIPPSGSLLGYVWDGGGTDFTVQVEIESANVE